MEKSNAPPPSSVNAYLPSSNTSEKSNKDKNISANIHGNIPGNPGNPGNMLGSKVKQWDDRFDQGISKQELPQQPRIPTMNGSTVKSSLRHIRLDPQKQPSISAARAIKSAMLINPQVIKTGKEKERDREREREREKEKEKEREKEKEQKELRDREREQKDRDNKDNREKLERIKMLPLEKRDQLTELTQTYAHYAQTGSTDGFHLSKTNTSSLSMLTSGSYNNTNKYENKQGSNNSKYLEAEREEKMDLNDLNGTGKQTNSSSPFDLLEREYEKALRNNQKNEKNEKNEKSEKSEKSEKIEENFGSNYEKGGRDGKVEVVERRLEKSRLSSLKIDVSASVQTIDREEDEMRREINDMTNLGLGSVENNNRRDRTCFQESQGPSSEVQPLCRLEIIGRGSSAVIYKSIILKSLQLCAEKVIVVADPLKRTQMMSELKSLKKTVRGRNGENRCVNIISLMDIVSNPRDGTISICLEYMDGKATDFLFSAVSVSLSLYPNCLSVSLSLSLCCLVVSLSLFLMSLILLV